MKLIWCERGDSNPHGFTRQILSLVRLPIPPLSHTFTIIQSGWSSFEVSSGAEYFWWARFCLRQAVAKNTAAIERLPTHAHLANRVTALRSVPDK
jgi:hypothetical protein